MAVVELESNSIVTLDKAFNEIERIPGLRSEVPDQKWRRHFTSSGSQKYLMTFHGNSGLMQFNLKESAFTKLEKFFCPDDFCVPMAATCSVDGLVVVGLSEWEVKGSTISILCPGEQVRYYQLALKFKPMGTALALEFDRDGKHVILGGSTRKSEKGEAILLVASADSSLKEMTIKLLEDVDQVCVSRILRVSDSNMLIVGAKTMISVVEFKKDNCRLVIVSKIKGFGHAGSDLISDIILVGSLLFACYENDKKLYTVKFKTN